MRDMGTDRKTEPLKDGCGSVTESLTGILKGKVPEDMDRHRLREERLRDKYAVPATDETEQNSSGSSVLCKK